MTSSRRNDPPKRHESDYPSPALYTPDAVASLEAEARRLPRWSGTRRLLMEMARRARADQSRRAPDGLPEPPEAA